MHDTRTYKIQTKWTIDFEHDETILIIYPQKGTYKANRISCTPFSNQPLNTYLKSPMLWIDIWAHGPLSVDAIGIFIT